MTTIHIASQFSSTPGGRFKRMGPSSGEEFRERLIQLLDKNQNVTVILDGAEGYGSSFLEEAFGGLVRSKKFSKEDILKRLHIVAKTPEYKSYEQEAISYIKDAISHT